MERPLKSYLRTFRRRWGLTQKELAFLIGAESPTTISRLEQVKRLPSAAATMACLILFDTNAFDIFPGLFSQIREDVCQRASRLYDELQGDGSAITRTKLDFLENVMQRAECGMNQDV